MIFSSRESWVIIFFRVLNCLFVFDSTLLSTIFQSDGRGQFFWWRKREYPEWNTDQGQVVIEKPYHVGCELNSTRFFLVKPSGPNSRRTYLMKHNRLSNKCNTFKPQMQAHMVQVASTVLHLTRCFVFRRKHKAKCNYFLVP